MDLDWLFEEEDTEGWEEYEGEYEAWSDCPENYRADNDFAYD